MRGYARLQSRVSPAKSSIRVRWDHMADRRDSHPSERERGRLIVAATGSMGMLSPVLPANPRGILSARTSRGNKRTTAPLRLGISRCLLGEDVRFDGGHKQDEFLTEVLDRYVEWVPVCPEVEAGLGTPREAMRLVGDIQNPRLITIKSRTDHTRALEAMSTNRIKQLKDMDLSGYVFKKGSPSCGIERVRIYNE